MTGRIYLCTTDDTCPRHGKFIYFCQECHDEWASTHPRTREAIAALAAGKVTVAAYRATAKAERTQEPTP